MDNLPDHFDDGGPAFPTTQSPGNPNFPGQYDVTAQAGMMLREYFAAHAPEPPDWFEPFALDHKKLGEPPQLDPQSDADKAVLRLWMQDRTTKVPAHLKDSLDRVAEWQLAKNKARVGLLAEAFFAWRWYYADMMLSGRLQKSRGPHTPELPVETEQ